MSIEEQREFVVWELFLAMNDTWNIYWVYF